MGLCSHEDLLTISSARAESPLGPGSPQPGFEGATPPAQGLAVIGALQRKAQHRARLPDVRVQIIASNVRSMYYSCMYLILSYLSLSINARSEIQCMYYRERESELVPKRPVRRVYDKSGSRPTRLSGECGEACKTPRLEEGQ